MELEGKGAGDLLEGTELGDEGGSEVVRRLARPHEASDLLAQALLQRSGLEGGGGKGRGRRGTEATSWSPLPCSLVCEERKPAEGVKTCLLMSRMPRRPVVVLRLFRACNGGQ